ncbi:MAG: NERD domain-containing protein [Gammaproteobacteria bacterium]|nr:NERD domain-containing protein [Gammaproteobacteria bacterium]
MLEKLKLALYKYKLKKYSNCYFNDVYIAKLDNDFHHLDYLFQCGDELLVVKCYDFDGNIYGADNISEWTQAISYSGYKFENPMRELKEVCDLLARNFVGKSVLPFAVFSDKCVFPKSMPEGVIHRTDLLTVIKNKYQHGTKSDCTSLDGFVNSGIKT